MPARRPQRLILLASHRSDKIKTVDFCLRGHSRHDRTAAGAGPVETLSHLGHWPPFHVASAQASPAAIKALV